MQDFPQHRFNIDHTRSVWEQMVENLEEGMMVKVQDFSENYTWLMPHEAQSIHWMQEQDTVYPVIVMQRVGNAIREDHLIILR